MDSYFASIAARLEAQGDLIRSHFRTHPGENGRNKESALAAHLRPLLPRRYALGTGFVAAAGKDLSNQNDIVIYDDFWSAPLFPDLASQLFPIESVYGIIEVKTTLNHAELESTVEKARRVKQMKQRGPNHPINVGIQEPFYALFAYNSTSLPALKLSLGNMYNDIPLNERLDFVVVLNEGLMHTGRYYDIATYGMPGSEHRTRLGDEGIAQKRKENVTEISGMMMGKHTFMTWYIYMMTYLSFSVSKVANLMHYLEPGEYGHRF